MNRVKFLHLYLLVAVMQIVVCSDDEEPFGPSLPDDTVFEAIPSSGILNDIVVDESRARWDIKTVEECQQLAILKGAHFFRSNGYCAYGTLRHPFCRTPRGHEVIIYVAEMFLTDGSPSDGAFLDSWKVATSFLGTPTRGFRVETPTILQIPGFTEKFVTWYGAKPMQYLFTNDGSVSVADGKYLIDPACYTNSSCGLVVITTEVESVIWRHFILHNVCGQTIDIGSEPGINVLSHEGIGCKFFPDVYPVSNCEVTISGSGPLKVNATLVNFRETTCDGSELVVDTPSSNGTTNAVDVCTENAPTVS
ncbi:hypothetical protein FHG87_013529 [Trinorchestia longiramus]|nr:hypothetical protein FHG87_013529 [Trinorchestia longiramus]